MKIGFVINPLAGIGGAVALKGSDGQEIVAQALSLGGQSQAQSRAAVALKKITATDELSFYTASGDMGENALIDVGLHCEVIYQTAAHLTAEDTKTTAEDTKNLVRRLVQNKVDLIVFTGGDGTARDVLDVLSVESGAGSAAEMPVINIPVIGIPAGVKIHSAVYAITPSHAGEMIDLLVSGEPMSMIDAQVMDLDEQAFREGKVNAKCYGYLPVPVDDTRMQLIKQGGLNHHEIAVQEIAADVIENMQQDVYYLIGSGSTTAEIMNQLDLPNTLLGIDIVCNSELVASDVDEKKILAIISSNDVRHEARIVITAIGGQGHIFGRGNQQLSASVISQVGKDNIIIIATNEKLRSLDKRPMIADTGDVILDSSLAGLYTVITGYQQKTLYKLNG